MLFMLVWIGGVTWSLGLGWNIALHGIHTTGTVAIAGECLTDSEIVAHVDYTDRAGVARQGTARTCNDNAPVGTTVGLRYLPSDPHNIVTDHDARQLRSTTIGLAFASAGGVALIGLFIWVWARWRRRT
ncbi:MAG TPA: hypothetical protein VGR57_14470 [Ktedonobacterales bacterium]|nr:hypothetical protein [Ktedonobacterales bacterium]